MIIISGAGIRPLCDKHRSPIVKTVLMAAAGASEAYRCEEAGCTRHYHGSIRYFDLLHGEIISDTLKRCCS